MEFYQGFCGLLAAALLCACNAGKPSVLLPDLNLSKHTRLTNSKTFHYAGAPAQFKVPSDVTQLAILAYGATGGGNPGARGAAVQATIPVRPGEVLTIVVGGQGMQGLDYGKGGGYNGGGGSYFGYGGGGSSDVRIGKALKDRIIVAAGGGGEGASFKVQEGRRVYWCYGGTGGVGGAGSGDEGSVGRCGVGPGGGGAGGSPQHGGTGGRGGKQGYRTKHGYPCDGVQGGQGGFLTGGEGGNACSGGGGGAGAGYYGGGGGGSGGCCTKFGNGSSGGGGGGGSSFVEKSATGIHRVGGGGPNGDGVVKISW